MAIATNPVGRIRAVVFDLDEALLLRQEAWRYAVEEAVISVTGRRIDARPLAGEYHARPWRHALAVLVTDARELARCEELCAAMFTRSAMKKLLVHDGLGMALDQLRGARVEMGAISREPHAVAIRQVESTGLERFLTVLSATPDGRWDVEARLTDCLRFVEQPAEACAFVGVDRHDLAVAAGVGLDVYGAGWAGAGAGEWRQIAAPGDLAAAIITRGPRAAAQRKR